MVDLFKGALEGLARERLLHSRGVDAEGAPNALRAVRDQPSPTMVVHVVSITMRPDEVWMLPKSCRLAQRWLASKHYLIVDRDTKYTQRTQQFRSRVEEGGAEVIRLPPSRRT